MSVWLPAAPCLPERCATPAHPAAPPPRAALRLAAGCAAVAAGLALAPLTAPLRPAVRHRLTRLWCRAVVRAFGVRVRVTGAPPPPGPLLVVANHVSWLDIPLVAAVLPGRMVAKREVRHWPLLGPLAALGGTLFLDRDRLRALPGAVRDLARTLAAGHRVVVFPEGSTWCGRAQGAFRPAAFQAALDAGAPVQPVRITYRPVGPAAFVGDDPLTASLWRVARAGRLTAEIRLLAPVPHGAHPDRRALARAAGAAVAAAGPPAARPPAARPAAGVGAAQTAVASDSAKRPCSSVHHRDSASPAAASSAAIPS
ncbi:MULTISPECIES: lysophospholipid acyltransferase family protein [Streptomyces]|uniref:1-acyl-sn-glycerol-3-phosphate acyltransferase n=4 Tax=Streptomyces TaxID=1883 RepID=A0A1D8GA60_9ACTN|nr:MULTISPECIES: lysophospholipid acyltransferase family protein [Streptomyces]AOT62345.1 1-acyl-sn-glycerol-3-phosphate acyltransferase [Streptomyces rubrolavendulae]OSY50666.1 1-acyl-sn-glycerol-3-phosphate acyltransferase [Streptomyces fradiae ATCC 10745 = DSM 40063]QEV15158.1 1-acyl-sn-glycerol-3-phosphate acyltransferase [Streptomyces fradiae ATCC 10745 = DSM 40063]